MNEAAIHAARNNARYHPQEDIKKVLSSRLESERRRRAVIVQKEKKITAYHEAGHAILFHLLPDVGPVYTVSIIPTGMGQQDTQCRFRRMMTYLRQKKMIQEITTHLADVWLRNYL